jgi:hypothetical protein
MWLTAAHAMRGKPSCHLRVLLKISYVFKFKIRITLLIFPECRGEVNAFPTAKLTKIFENECVTKKKIQTTIRYDTPDTERAKVSWNGNFSQPM